jgi:hypothetical protein
MANKILTTIFLFLLLTAQPCVGDGDEGPIKVKGVIHLNSNVSSGKYSPERLVKMARGVGLKAVFLNENFMPKWEFGAYPFRGIIKKTVEKESLLKYGPRKYGDRIEFIDGKLPDMTVIMGAEVAPLYYWTGNPFGEPGLTLNNWDIQLLVTGMDAGDYEGIPTVSSGRFSRYGPKSVLMLWPFALIILGAVSLKKKHPRFYLADPLCWGLILAGVFFALYNYPYKAAKYDQYHGDPGIGPYQEVIDHVNENGGMTFWSAPEAKGDTFVGPVRVVSRSAEEHMKEARGYTGFCCFYEGYRKIGGPGGVWDELLGEYCRGERKKPIWTIGEMAYHSAEASGGKDINEVQTVFFVPSNTRENLLEAIASGKMYAVRRTKEYALKLDSFTAKYDNEEAGMGEELTAAGPVTVTFEAGWEGKCGDKVTASLIRSGEVIKEFIMGRSGAYEYKDKLYEPGKKVYYRLDIRGKYPSMLFSNPIFVKFAGGEGSQVTSHKSQE